MGLGGDDVLAVGDVQPGGHPRRERRRGVEAVGHERAQAEQRAERHEQRQRAPQPVRTLVRHDRPERVADDRPRVGGDEAQHRLPGLRPGRVVGQVAGDLSEGREEKPLGDVHPHVREPGDAGERLDGLAHEVAEPHGPGPRRGLGDVECEAGLLGVGGFGRGALGDPFEPLQGEGLGQGRLLRRPVAGSSPTLCRSGVRNNSP